MTWQSNCQLNMLDDSVELMFHLQTSKVLSSRSQIVYKHNAEITKYFGKMSFLFVKKKN